jgi:hypothetical protein
VVIYDGLDNAQAVTLTSCGWDTKPGWVARENVKVGNANWAKGIAPKYSGDYMLSESGGTPQWGKEKQKSVESWCQASFDQGADIYRPNNLASCRVSKGE